MPKAVFSSDYRFLPRSELLSFEEIERVVKSVASLGVDKIRLTGGEPLLRRDLEHLIERLAVVAGIRDLSLTTNASLLSAERARSLASAGLKRVNVSLDALDNDTFARINDVDIAVDAVLTGIEAASDAGLGPVKINMVVKKGLNDHDILPMARHFHGSGHILRFIEFMDVGNSNGWGLDEVFTGAEIVERIHAELPIETLEPNYRGEVARRWRYQDGGGEIGIITSVSEPFCGNCSRARLSATGSLYTCLFSARGHDLRPLLRDASDPAALDDALHRIWEQRSDRYSETRSQESVLWPKVEMSFIGG